MLLKVKWFLPPLAWVSWRVLERSSNFGMLKPPPRWAGHFDSHRWWHLVVLHAHHHLFVYCEPGCISYRREDDHTHRECSRSFRADRYQIWNTWGRIYNDLLPSKSTHQYFEKIMGLVNTFLGYIISCLYYNFFLL